MSRIKRDLRGPEVRKKKKSPGLQLLPQQENPVFVTPREGEGRPVRGFGLGETESETPSSSAPAFGA